MQKQKKIKTQKHKNHKCFTLFHDFTRRTNIAQRNLHLMVQYLDPENSIRSFLAHLSGLGTLTLGKSEKGSVILPYSLTDVFRYVCIS